MTNFSEKSKCKKNLLYSPKKLHCHILSPQVEHLFSWLSVVKQFLFGREFFSTLFVLCNSHSPPLLKDTSIAQEYFSPDSCFLKDFTRGLLAAKEGVVANMLITLHANKNWLTLSVQTDIPIPHPMGIENDVFLPKLSGPIFLQAPNVRQYTW